MSAIEPTFGPDSAMPSDWRRGENVATHPRPIPPRPIVLPYVPEVWEDGPPTLIAIVGLIGIGLAIAFFGWIVVVAK